MNDASFRDLHEPDDAIDELADDIIVIPSERRRGVIRQLVQRAENDLFTREEIGVANVAELVWLVDEQMIEAVVDSPYWGFAPGGRALAIRRNEAMKPLAQSAGTLEEGLPAEWAARTSRT